MASSSSRSSSENENDDDDENHHNYNFDYDEHQDHQSEEDNQKVHDRKVVLEQLQEDCDGMMKTLKRLHQEEVSIRCQNKILAREIVHCGYRGREELLECTVDGSGTSGSSVDRDGNVVQVPSKRPKKKCSNGDVNNSLAASTTITSNNSDVVVKKEDRSCSADADVYADADVDDNSILVTDPRADSIDGAVDCGGDVFNITLKEENE